MPGTNFPSGILVNKNALALDTKVVQASISPSAITSGSGATSNVAVSGLGFGKWIVGVIAPGDLQGLTVTAYVSATNTVAIRFHNGTGGSVTPPSGVYTIQAVKVVP